MPAIVDVSNLAKRFGETVAVDDVSFSVERGEIFGLLGPNGAGKTTTIGMISCLLDPDGGTIVVDGHSTVGESSAVRATLGVVPQEIALYPTLTAAENLAFWGRMYGLTGGALKEAIAAALDVAGLADRAKERIEKYSGGMKRRINIAAGVLHAPKVLLMDEPTVGIDPQSRNHILETVKDLNRAGTTVLYTSHYMEEVEYLCDRIAIMDHGRLIAMGTLPELRELVGGMDSVAVALDGEAEGLEEAVRSLPGVARAERTEAGLTVLSPDSAAVLSSLVSALERSGARITSLTVTEPNLESVFLHLTGKSLRN